MDDRPIEHMGDGVYAIFDGFGITLNINDHQFPTDTAYLEPQILNALIRFAKRNGIKIED